MSKGKLVWKRDAIAKGLAAVGAGNSIRPYQCYKDGKLIMSIYNNSWGWHTNGDNSWLVSFRGKEMITMAKKFPEDKIEEAKKWAESTRWDILMAENEKSIWWPHKQKLGW